MNLQEYIITINKRYQSGIAREHTYRTDLESLIRKLVPEVEITNEPANVTDCGNPDYVITRKKIPVGFIEAKDIGKDITSKTYKEQFDRYRKALDNLIITDYMYFRFYDHGNLIHEIKIAEIDNNTIKPLTENFAQFENLIKNFCSFIGQTIKSSKKLAEMMAAKARLLQNILERAVSSDEQTEENTSLREQYKTFKNILIHDLTPKTFADIYAQTLAYGMFAARLHDKTLDDFSRQEAAELIPKSNPFLRKLFGYVAGPDIDERIVRTVDNLANVFLATNVEELLKNFGKSTQTHDPIIHFYETFLAEYDPKLRKSRGVWYTPEPVVNFIVRAVDDILKTEFNLPDGLADTTKTKIKVKEQGNDKTVEKEVHKVQILDPATGTGTFLAEVVKHIYKHKFKAMQGVWSSYIDEHLIPRLNGFELLMASYSMAHLKLDMLLTETGYKATKNQRFNIYLTNSLEEHHPDTGTLFSNWLSTEANEANHIKRDTPVMCVIGNPPYSGISINKGKWITNLIEDYKYVDGVHFGERKHWLQDDYVKFLRFGEHFINKNGEGVLAFINNHSFIDNPTFRGMRWHLLNSFDKIYIIDLHGNSIKKEVCPNGSKDENIFDITAGVSINLFIKIGKKKKGKLAEVFHFDAWGKRKEKYEYLWNNDIKSIAFNEVSYQKPFYFFQPKNFELEKRYLNFINLSKLFIKNNTGVCSQRDIITMQYNKSELVNILKDFSELQVDEIRKKYRLTKDGRDWKIITAKENVLSYSNFEEKINKVQYRIFDSRFTFYSNKSKGFIAYPRYNVFNHLLKDNLCFLMNRTVKGIPFNHAFITDEIPDLHLFETANASIYGSPLYLYPNKETDGMFSEEGLSEKGRKPNLNPEIVQKIADKLGLEFVAEKPFDSAQGGALSEVEMAPIDILDYIYAVLHSPNYREKYKEFLKIDFPRVPYPKNTKTFWQLVKLGGEIRQIHLLESPKVNEFITSYPVDGTNQITTKIAKKDWEITGNIQDLSGFGNLTGLPKGRIYINETQYFDNIPLIAWEFYIGGYQPAQKWLKDRAPKKGQEGRTLTYEDITHYQKIIVALSETDRIMKEIDEIEIELYK
ncbi:MAG: N-6 DNA methylase [Chlorobi bacterium]|nr:N-6 DNA methylase [Chlorobiota bacterium]